MRTRKLRFTGDAAQGRSILETVGAQLHTKPKLFRALEGDVTNHSFASDGVQVLIHERYFVRLRSTLMAVIIFDFTRADACEVTVVVGGGKTSWFSGYLMDFGAEEEMLDKITSLLQHAEKSSLMSIKVSRQSKGEDAQQTSSGDVANRAAPEK